MLEWATARALGSPPPIVKPSWSNEAQRHVIYTTEIRYLMTEVRLNTMNKRKLNAMQWPC